MIITLISPDKLTLSMFIDFYRTLYLDGRELSLIPINYNLSLATKKSIIDSVKEKYNSDKDLILFSIKIPYDVKGIKEPELSQHYAKYYPLELEIISTYIVAFDIYSVTPVIIKDRIGNFIDIVKRWESNLKKLGDA